MSKYRHPIYGRKPRVIIRPSVPTTSSETYCYNPCPGLIDSFIALEDAIFNVERALQQYYQANRAVADFIAKMSARCTVHPMVFVRLVWRQAHPNETFNIMDPLQRLQIKYIYIYFNLNYKDDPLFKDALGLTLI